MPQRCGAGRSFEDVRRRAGENDIALYWLGTGDIPFGSGDAAFSHGDYQELHFLARYWIKNSIRVNWRLLNWALTIGKFSFEEAALSAPP